MGSMFMAWRNLHHNFFIDNYSPQEGVDNDDGSMRYYTHDNFLVYGGQGMKTDFGGHDNHHFNNIYAYVGRAMGVTNTYEGHEDYFYGNKVVLTRSAVGPQPSFTITLTSHLMARSKSAVVTFHQLKPRALTRIAQWQQSLRMMPLLVGLLNCSAFSSRS